MMCMRVLEILFKIKRGPTDEKSISLFHQTPGFFQFLQKLTCLTISNFRNLSVRWTCNTEQSNFRSYRV